MQLFTALDPYYFEEIISRYSKKRDGIEISGSDGVIPHRSALYLYPSHPDPQRPVIHLKGWENKMYEEEDEILFRATEGYRIFECHGGSRNGRLLYEYNAGVDRRVDRYDQRGEATHLPDRYAFKEVTPGNDGPNIDNLERYIMLGVREGTQKLIDYGDSKGRGWTHAVDRTGLQSYLMILFMHEMQDHIADDAQTPIHLNVTFGECMLASPPRKEVIRHQSADQSICSKCARSYGQVDHMYNCDLCGQIVCNECSTKSNSLHPKRICKGNDWLEEDGFSKWIEIFFSDRIPICFCIFCMLFFRFSQNINFCLSDWMIENGG